MDLSKFNVEKQAEQGAWMELEDPVTGDVLTDDNGEPVAIKLLGTDSKAWREKNREFQRRRVQDMARKKKNKIDFTVTDDDACEILAECTVDWKGLEEDGEVLEFSQEAAFDLYMRHIWIREQADAFIGDRANFFPSA